MRFGPLSPVHLNKLKEMLDAHGAQYQIFSDPEVDKRARVENLEAEPRVYPTFTGHLEYLYIDIEDKDQLIVKEELLKLGFTFAKSDPPELPYENEYICTKCDFSSKDPGMCPHHGVKLLEWHDWNEYRRQNKGTSRRFMAIVMLIIVIYMVLKITAQASH